MLAAEDRPILRQRLGKARLAVGAVAEPLVVSRAASGRERRHQQRRNDSARGDPASHAPVRPSIAR